MENVVKEEGLNADKCRVEPLVSSSKRSFFACDNVSHQGETNTWFTPRDVIDRLGVTFDLDPCTQTYRPYDISETVFCEDKGDDGLLLPWYGRVWLNPPYGREVKHWLDKLQSHGNGIALVFSRTETEWAQKCLLGADAVNFMKGRISFMKADGTKGTNAGNGSMLLAFGASNIDIIKRFPGVIFKKS